MAIGIQTNNSAINVNRNLGIIKKDENDSAKKIASGYKINSAKDDASGLSISEKLKAQIAATYAASSNAQTGVSAIQVADGAMDQMQSMLTRVSELSVQAGGIQGYGDGGKAIQAEIEALTSEIDRISASTSFNGNNLLDGSTDSLSLQVGTTNNSYDSVDISISNMSAESLGLGNIDVTTDPAAALEAVTNAINTVSSSRADLGATTNRLEYTVSNLNNSAENLTSANAVISETDISKEVIELALKKAQEKAAQTKLAQANQQPSIVAALLLN